MVVLRGPFNMLEMEPGSLKRKQEIIDVIIPDLVCSCFGGSHSNVFGAYFLLYTQGSLVVIFVPNWIRPR